MKKALILYILLIAFSLLMADTIRDNEIINSGEKSPHLNQCYYTGLLRASIEFSQEEYAVGDTIEVTIHFKVNTEQNTENVRFAVADYKNNSLYVMYESHLEQITTEVIEELRNEFSFSSDACAFVESDADLILSNENPMGDYHITFKLIKKCHVAVNITDRNSDSYVFRSLKIYPFTEVTEHPCITEYKSELSPYEVVELTIPIPLSSAAKTYQKLKRTLYSSIGEFTTAQTADNVDSTSTHPAKGGADWKYFSPTHSSDQLYSDAMTALSVKDDSTAKSNLKTLILKHPDSKLAHISVQHLLDIEKRNGHNYLELQEFYQSIISADYPQHIQTLCDEYWNKCNLCIENYPEAIGWYIDKINNPLSFSNAMFALIELNYTYLQLDEGIRAAFIDPQYCFMPLTCENYSQTRDQLINMSCYAGFSVKKDVLAQSLPHLFNADITISFNLPQESMVNLTICDAKGEEVACLINEKLKKGEHTAVWQGVDDAGNPVEAQMYAYVLKVNGTTEREKRFLLLQ
jgi:hypothetical protein